MVKVVNLGKVSRRPSELFGLSEALATGLEFKISKETLEQRERERKSTQKASENKLSAELASQSLRKREQDIANVRKTHEQFSLLWNGMDAQQKAIFRGSEQYKETQKFFKGFKKLVPNLISDNGDIVAETNKDIFKKKLEGRVAQAKGRLANGQGTREDIELLKISEGDKDLLAEALDNASKKLDKNDAGDPRTVAQHVGSFFQNAKKKLGTFDQLKNPLGNQDALKQPADVAAPPPSASSPQAVNSNTNALRDPLGIR